MDSLKVYPFSTASSVQLTSLSPEAPVIPQIFMSRNHFCSSHAWCMNLVTCWHSSTPFKFNKNHSTGGALMTPMTPMTLLSFLPAVFLFFCLWRRRRHRRRRPLKERQRELSEVASLVCKLKRLRILGCCAAGKSNLRKCLAEVLQLPAVEMDSIYWKLGFFVFHRYQFFFWMSWRTVKLPVSESRRQEARLGDAPSR